MHYELPTRISDLARWCQLILSGRLDFGLDVYVGQRSVSLRIHSRSPRYLVDATTDITASLRSAGWRGARATRPRRLRSGAAVRRIARARNLQPLPPSTMACTVAAGRGSTTRCSASRKGFVRTASAATHYSSARCARVGTRRYRRCWQCWLRTVVAPTPLPPQRRRGRGPAGVAGETCMIAEVGFTE